MKKKRKTAKSVDINKLASSDDRNMVATIGMVVGMVVCLGLVFFGLKALFGTESYYVLKDDIPARTQVQTDMLQEVKVSKGGAPANSIPIGQVKDGLVFTKVPLNKGDVLSKSNTGIELDTTTGIPDNWVVTSFNISSNDAVGGNIQRGDYFDIIGVNENEGTYLFTNVLALQVNQATPNTEKDQKGNVTKIDEVLQYVVGMPPEDAARLQQAIAKYSKDGAIKLVVSPNQISYEKRDTSSLGSYSISGVRDLFDGTDSSFTRVKRGKDGRPVTPANCADGLIKPKELCKGVKFSDADKSSKQEKKVKHENKSNDTEKSENTEKDDK